MTLYLKYRPKNLDELDLPQVAETLKKIVNSDSLPHAFLFSGPKGTGKTSAARILAKIINCEKPGKDNAPCDDCEQCKSIIKGNNLDVIEMDAASHRGIDDVRALKDAVKLTPVKAKKKIYIIDEAHMLTLEASNALLKTLEEPPDHVVFILATTNPEKLIETIRSRTTIVSFRKARTEEIVRALKRVAEGEKINITDNDLERITLASGGAFRDAIKILEQFSIEGAVFLDDYNTIDLVKLTDSLIKKDATSCVSEIENNITYGKSAEFLIRNLQSLIHESILGHLGLGSSKLKGLSLDELLSLSALVGEASRTLPDSPIEQLSLEVAIVKWCRLFKTGKSEELKEGNTKTEAESDTLKIIEQNKSLETSSIPMDTIEEIKFDDTIWKNILLAVHPINVSIEGLLRSSRPIAYDGKSLTLGVFYKFHKERLEDVRHRKILEEVITKILNSPTKIICTLVEPTPSKILEVAAKEPILTESAEPDIIKAAEEIFGN